MLNYWFKKGLVLIVIVLFVIVGVFPYIFGNSAIFNVKSKQILSPTFGSKKRRSLEKTFSFSTIFSTIFSAKRVR